MQRGDVTGLSNYVYECVCVCVCVCAEGAGHYLSEGTAASRSLISRLCLRWTCCVVVTLLQTSGNNRTGRMTWTSLTPMYDTSQRNKCHTLFNYTRLRLWVCSGSCKKGQRIRTRCRYFVQSTDRKFRFTVSIPPPPTHTHPLSPALLFDCCSAFVLPEFIGFICS